MARPGLTQHRKFRRLARALDSEPLALGCLEFLWETCYQNGDDYLGDVLDVEAAAHWDGEQEKLCTALLTAGGDGNHGFIDELDDRPGHYRCHDLFDHAPRYVSRRLQKEMEREANGVSISEIRAAAGRKGAAVTNSKRTANVGKESANGQQFVVTPAPAPAPAPIESKPSSSELEGSSDQVRAKDKIKTQHLPSREASQLAALLKTEMLLNSPTHKITQAQERKWGRTADLMLRLDHRTPEQIAEVIRWAQHDTFWMTNILSMEKLRKQFGQLSLKMRANGGSSALVKLPDNYVSVSEKMRAAERRAPQGVA
ncbi:MAG: hypothetical protein WAQ52_07945 [Terriglobales bacterium]